MNLVVVLCDSCSSGNIDELALTLLNVFESRGMSFQLLKALIEHEVSITGEWQVFLKPKNFVSARATDLTVF